MSRMSIYPMKIVKQIISNSCENPLEITNYTYLIKAIHKTDGVKFIDVPSRMAMIIQV